MNEVAVHFVILTQYLFDPGGIPDCAFIHHICGGDFDPAFIPYDFFVIFDLVYQRNAGPVINRIVLPALPQFAFARSCDSNQLAPGSTGATGQRRYDQGKSEAAIPGA